MKPWPLLRPALLLATLALAACGSAGPPTPAGSAAGHSATASPSAGQDAPGSTSSGQSGQAGALPAFAHTVVVVMENHSYSEVIGSPQAPYIHALAREGALFTQSRAVSHPSEPNYLALFSGSTQGVTSDNCPETFGAANLASELIAAHRTFQGYVGGLAPQCGDAE